MLVDAPKCLFSMLYPDFRDFLNPFHLLKQCIAYYAQLFVFGLPTEQTNIAKLVREFWMQGQAGQAV